MAVVVSVYGKSDLKQITNAEKKLASMKREVVSQQPAWKKFGSAVSSTGAKIASGLAAAGIARWLIGSVKVAAAAEVITTKLRTVVQAATKGSWSWGAYEASMKGVVDKQSQISAYSGGTLKGALATLTQTTGSASKGLDLLALSTDLARGKSMDLNKASLLVGKVAMGNTTALSRYGIVLKKGSTIQENLAALQSRFAGQAKAYGDTSAGAQEKFGNALRKLQVTVGTAILPVLTSLSGKLIGVLNAFQNLPGPVKNVIIGVAAVAGAALLLAPFVTAIIGVGKAMQLAALASKIWAAGQWLLNAAMTANPIGIIIIAIVALVAAFVVLWTKCAWFRDFWIAVWGIVKAEFALVWPAIKVVVDLIVAGIKWLWDTVSAAAIAFWDWAGPFITAGVQFWWSVISTTFTLIIGVVQAAWTAISAAVTWFWDWAGPYITTAIGLWWTNIQTTMGLIKTVFSTVWDAIVLVVQTAVTAVKTAVDVIGDVIEVVREIWRKVKVATSDAWDLVVGFVGAAWTAIKLAVDTVKESVVTAVGDVWTAVKTRTETAWGAVTGVVSVVVDAWNAVKNEAVNIKDDVVTAVGDVWTAVKNKAGPVWDDIVGIVKTAWNKIAGFVNDIIDAINWVVDKVPGMGSVGRVPKLPSFSTGGAADGPSTGYPVIMHGRETVVAHDNPGRGLADLVNSGILGGGKTPPRASNTSALTFETRGPHVGADSSGRSILGSIGSALGSAAGWVTDLVSKYNIFNMLPKPVGGLFGGVTNALLDMGKDAIIGLLTRFGLGDRQKIVNFALSQLGMPYVWGGASPAAGGFDCSGLMQWAYRQAGHNVDWRVPTYGGRQIGRGDVQPADIMFYYPGAIQNGVRVPFGHFKMYAGNGETVESTSGGVQRRAADWGGAAQIRSYLARGGYVPRTPGGLAAVLGEGNEGEWVVPESKVGRFAAAALAGSGGVYIAPGAVVVDINAPNAGSPAEVTAAVRAGVDPALEALARAITAL